MWKVGYLKSGNIYILFITGQCNFLSHAYIHIYVYTICTVTELCSSYISAMLLMGCKICKVACQLLECNHCSVVSMDTVMSGCYIHMIAKCTLAIRHIPLSCIN